MQNSALPFALVTLTFLGLYTSSAQQPNTAVSATQQRYYAALAEGVKGASLRKTETVGLPTGTDFSDFRPEGGFLTGFDLWKSNYKKTVVINGIRPIYQTPAGKIRGNSY